MRTAHVEDSAALSLLNFLPTHPLISYMDTHGHQNISTRQFPYSDTLSTPLRLFYVSFLSALSCQSNHLLVLIFFVV
jgi:hypothetical protein